MQCIAIQCNAKLFINIYQQKLTIINFNKLKIEITTGPGLPGLTFKCQNVNCASVAERGGGGERVSPINKIAFRCGWNGDWG